MTKDENGARHAVPGREREREREEKTPYDVASTKRALRKRVGPSVQLESPSLPAHEA